MTNLVISSDFNLSNPQDFFGNNPTRSNVSPNGFHVYDAGTGNNIYVSGQNIQYNVSGQAISGTVNSIVCITGNGQETLFNMTDANIDIQYANSQDWPTFRQELDYWLGTNPSITTVDGGINGSEIISAPTGANQVFGYTGNNTIVYAAPSTEFTINVDNLLSTSNGFLTVTQGDPVTSNNVNELHAIQKIQFSDITIDTSWLTGASTLKTIDAADFNFLTEVYLAYYDRAPDAVGLDFWAAAAYNMHNANPSAPMSDAIKDIANTFATSPETIAAFGTINSNSSIPELQNFVTKVYENVLNRGPDAEGLSFWVDALHYGNTTPGEFIYNFVSVVNDQHNSIDKIYLTNKTAVGEHFAVTNGMTDLTQAREVMDTYNAVYNTAGVNAAVNAANALTDSFYSGEGMAANPELIVHLVGIQ